MVYIIFLSRENVPVPPLPRHRQRNHLCIVPNHTKHTKKARNVAVVAAKNNEHLSIAGSRPKHDTDLKQVLPRQAPDYAGHRGCTRIGTRDFMVSFQTTGPIGEVGEAGGGGRFLSWHHPRNDGVFFLFFCHQCASLTVCRPCSSTIFSSHPGCPKDVPLPFMTRGFT